MAENPFATGSRLMRTPMRETNPNIFKDGDVLEMKPSNAVVFAPTVSRTSTLAISDAVVQKDVKVAPGHHRVVRAARPNPDPYKTASKLTTFSSTSVRTTGQGKPMPVVTRRDTMVLDRRQCNNIPGGNKLARTPAKVTSSSIFPQADPIQGQDHALRTPAEPAVREEILRAHGSTQSLLKNPDQLGTVVPAAATDMAGAGTINDVDETRTAGPAGTVGWSGVPGSIRATGAVGSISTVGHNHPAPAAMPTPPSSITFPTPVAPPSVEDVSGAILKRRLDFATPNASPAISAAAACAASERFVLGVDSIKRARTGEAGPHDQQQQSSAAAAQPSASSEVNVITNQYVPVMEAPLTSVDEKVLNSNSCAAGDSPAKTVVAEACSITANSVHEQLSDLRALEAEAQCCKAEAARCRAAAVDLCKKLAHFKLLEADWRAKEAAAEKQSALLLSSMVDTAPSMVALYQPFLSPSGSGAASVHCAARFSASRNPPLPGSAARALQAPAASALMPPPALPTTLQAAPTPAQQIEPCSLGTSEALPRTACNFSSVFRAVGSESPPAPAQRLAQEHLPPPGATTGSLEEAAPPTAVPAAPAAQPESPANRAQAAEAVAVAVGAETVQPAREPPLPEQDAPPSALLRACRPRLRFGGQKSRVHSMQVLSKEECRSSALPPRVVGAAGALFTADDAGCLRFWELPAAAFSPGTRRCLALLRGPKGMSCARLCGGWIYFAALDGSAARVDAATARTDQQLRREVDGSSLLTLDVLPLTSDGTDATVALAGQGSRVRVWQIRGRPGASRELAVEAGEAAWVNAVALAACPEPQLALACSDGVRALQLGDGAAQLLIHGAGTEGAAVGFHAVCFSPPEGHHLLGLSAAAELCVWDVAARHLLRCFRCGPASARGGGGLQPAHDWGLGGFEVSRSGRFVCMGSVSHGLRVVDTTCGSAVLIHEGAAEEPVTTQQVAWNADWELGGRKGRPVFFSSGSSGGVYAWSPDLGKI